MTKIKSSGKSKSSYSALVIMVESHRGQSSAAGSYQVKAIPGQKKQGDK